MENKKVLDEGLRDHKRKIREMLIRYISELEKFRDYSDEVVVKHKTFFGLKSNKHIFEVPYELVKGVADKLLEEYQERLDEVTYDLYNSKTQEDDNTAQ